MAEQEFENNFKDCSDSKPLDLRKTRPIKSYSRSPLPPVGFRGTMAEAHKLGDTTFATFPMSEQLGEDDAPIWEPLPLKTLKELQNAVKTVGASAPYTLQILDMVASLWLTPYDWIQTAKATLSPDDYIL